MRPEYDGYVKVQLAIGSGAAAFGHAGEIDGRPRGCPRGGRAEGNALPCCGRRPGPQPGRGRAG
eukprot:9974336-Alexandrium_andersonii.AAC.1